MLCLTLWHYSTNAPNTTKNASLCIWLINTWKVQWLFLLYFGSGECFFMWVSSLEQRNIMKETASTIHSSHPMTALISRLKQFRPWVSGYFQLQYIKLTIWKYLHYPLNVKELWIVSIETLMSFIPFYRSEFVQVKILLVKFQ